MSKASDHAKARKEWEARQSEKAPVSDALKLSDVDGGDTHGIHVDIADSGALCIDAHGDTYYISPADALRLGKWLLENFDD